MPRVPVRQPAGNHGTMANVNVASGFLPPGRPDHFGIDIAGKAGDPVGAPEACSVVQVFGAGTDGTRADNTSVPAPWGGYGPAGVLLKGDSGVFHLLAHMDPQGWGAPEDHGTEPTPGSEPTLETAEPVVSAPTVGRHYDEGWQIGRMPTHVGASGPHVHWEVRREPIDNPTTRALNTWDPRLWVARGGDVSGLPFASVFSKGASIPWWVWAALAFVVLSRRR